MLDPITAFVNTSDILDELFDGVYLMDAERRIRLWNAGAERITGYPRGNVVGLACHLGPLRHEDAEGCRLCEEKCPAQQSMESGQPAVAVVFLHRADDVLLPVETHIRPLRDDAGRVVGAVEVFRDISQWKEVERLAREKDRLMGVLAHDIRNPLTVMQTYAHVLRHRPESDLQEIGQTLQRRTRYALDLVNGLLNAQAIESGTVALDIRDLELGPALRGILENFQGLARDKGITLHLSDNRPGLVLPMDPVRFEEVINNLVGNAIRYSPADTTVEVGLDANDQAVVISVKDQGVGIKPEELDRLFKPFGRTSSRPTGGEKSHGLGLYIVKRILDLFAATIAVESQPGQGTTFKIRFPFAGCALPSGFPNA